jgi:hypothetical protein
MAGLADGGSEEIITRTMSLRCSRSTIRSRVMSRSDRKARTCRSSSIPSDRIDKADPPKAQWGGEDV